jgi:hypothetical protein
MKNLTITPPEGYEIDKKQSTFENIVFKPLIKGLPKSWEDLKEISGYYVDSYSNVECLIRVDSNCPNLNIFATTEQAKACLALAQLSQLMAVYNDGWVPDWTVADYKYVIYFVAVNIEKSDYKHSQHFLAFKTEELRNEFLENFRDLILTAKPLL